MIELLFYLAILVNMLLIKQGALVVGLYWKRTYPSKVTPTLKNSMKPQKLMNKKPLTICQIKNYNQNYQIPKKSIALSTWTQFRFCNKK